MSRLLGWGLALAFGLGACAHEDGASSARAALATWPEVALEDVAILFPLPDTLASAGGLLTADQVVSANVVNQLPPLVQGDAIAVTATTLRVVALRVEPCFATGASPACRRQLRFVLQPVVADPTGHPTTLDAAVHLLYDLDDAAFGALLDRLVVARRAARNSAPAALVQSKLAVHPVMVAEGLAGPFATAVRAAAVAAVAQAQLTRATFLSVRGRGNEWAFGGFDVHAGALTPLPIPTSGAVSQSLVLQRGGQSFSKSASPSADPGLAPLLDSFAALAASAADRTAALAAANRIENPELRSSEDTDCVSCHTAPGARTWGESSWGVTSAEGRYPAASAELGATTKFDLDVLRAFGFFGRDPIVSPRVVHESVRAAARINAERSP